MRKAGLEPARPNSHKNLNLACLPIPTLPRTKDNLSELYLLVNKYFHFIFSDQGFNVFRSFYNLQPAKDNDHHAACGKHNYGQCRTFDTEPHVIEK